MYDLSKKECMFKVTETRGSRKIVLRHFFRLPSLQDWIAYHKGVSELGLSRGRETFEVSDNVQAKNLELWEKLVTKVQGYVVDGKDVQEQENWRDLIPFPHKVQAVNGFMTTWRRTDDVVEEVVLDLGSDDVEVSIVVLQNVDDTMTQHEIIFHFTSPDAMDYKNISKLQSRMRLTRTKERNVSSISVPTDIKPYVQLFDKLIIRVEGYIYDGKDLMEHSEWKSKIDAFHKREAIGDLFTSEFEDDEGN